MDLCDDKTVTGKKWSWRRDSNSGQKLLIGNMISFEINALTVKDTVRH